MGNNLKENLDELVCIQCKKKPELIVRKNFVVLLRLFIIKRDYRTRTKGGLRL